MSTSPEQDLAGVRIEDLHRTGLELDPGPSGEEWSPVNAVSPSRAMARIVNRVSHGNVPQVSDASPVRDDRPGAGGEARVSGW